MPDRMLVSSALLSLMAKQIEATWSGRGTLDVEPSGHCNLGLFIYPSAHKFLICQKGKTRGMRVPSSFDYYEV